MPDFRKDNALWLEKELARHLTPVAAPESLWDRINRQEPKPRRRVSLHRAFWPVLVAMVLLAAAGILHTLKADRNPDALTEQELAMVAGSPEGFDFRSDSFEDTRAWVKAEANIDIDLPPGGRGAVRLLGARLIQFRGLPIAAIDYRVGNEVATLFVSSGKHAGFSEASEAPAHLFSRVKSTGNAQLFSWNMRNQTYTIAFSGARKPEGACLLCHASTPGMILFGLP